jgi:hypothetical protein
MVWKARASPDRGVTRTAGGVSDSSSWVGVPQAERPPVPGPGRSAYPLATLTDQSSNALIPTGSGVGRPAPEPLAPVLATTAAEAWR